MSSLPIRLGIVGGLGVALAAITAGGTLVGARQPGVQAVAETEGRTVTICPAAATVSLASTTQWGSLGSRTLEQTELQPLPAGRGTLLTDPGKPVLMVAEGRQDQGAAASAYARHGVGRERGISLARCGTPGTSTWFTGLVANPDDPQRAIRSEIHLVNPDAKAAEVDLVVFGPTGLQPAPGSREIAVAGNSVRVVALDSLFARPEPVGVHVRTNRGRVAAVVRQYASAGAQPVGNDWHVASTPPAAEQVVPGIPGGPGPRTLVLSNPGGRRTTATVEVLGKDGSFAPVDASQVDVNAESTTSVSLTNALTGEPAALRIRADQPLVAAVVARSAEDAPNADIAIQPSAPPLAGTAIGAVAAAPGSAGAVLLTNPGAAELTVPGRLIGADGTQLLSTEIRVPPGSTTRWALDQIPQPATVVVDAPAGGMLHGAIVLSSAADPAAGLATTPLSVTARSSHAGSEARFDAGAGR